ILLLSCLQSGQSQQSIARQWNEIQIQSIREDFARPPVHARNLFHLSVLMYDMWAVYDTTGQSETYFLGKTVGNYTCPFNGITIPADIEAARRQAISYAAYRLLHSVFRIPRGRLPRSPGFLISWRSSVIRLILTVPTIPPAILQRWETT
ncbi:MAG: hypothetical protein ACKOCH_12015, partial [Bacteroidota bacterium]